MPTREELWTFRKELCEDLVATTERLINLAEQEDHLLESIMFASMANTELGRSEDDIISLNEYFSEAIERLKLLPAFLRGASQIAVDGDAETGQITLKVFDAGLPEGKGGWHGGHVD